MATSDFRVAHTLHRARRMVLLPATGGEPRPQTRGALVEDFVLPLELCQTTNRTRGAAGWKLGKTKAAIFQLLWLQAGGRRSFPLPGRPQVILTRFSSTEPDKYADWGKAALDMLCTSHLPGKKRLNIIQDDAPKHAEIWQLWRPAKPGEGFVYIEVWTGEEGTK